MSTRWNGHDLQDPTAFVQELPRRIRIPKGQKEEILFYFEIMRRIRTAARRLTRRDEELIDAVLRNRSLTGAARDLAPEKPETLRSYLSQRLKVFKQLTKILLGDLPENDENFSENQEVTSG